MRETIFHPRARETLRSFPDGVKREIGKAIFELQKGERLSLPLSKPMPSVGQGVEELRIRDQSRAYRVFYFVKSIRGVLVFHAFVKKTRKTAPREIALGRQRLREMLLYEKNQTPIHENGR